MTDTNPLHDLLNRPPDFSYTDTQAVDDGVLVDLTALGVHVHFEGRTVTRMSSNLFDQLAFYNPGGSKSEQSAAYQALLGFIIHDAADTGGEGEYPGCIYQSQNTFHALGCKRVWLHPNSAGWTAMLPEDY